MSRDPEWVPAGSNPVGRARTRVLLEHETGGSAPRKLGLQGRVQVVIYAYERGIAGSGSLGGPGDRPQR